MTTHTLCKQGAAARVSVRASVATVAVAWSSACVLAQAASLPTTVVTATRVETPLEASLADVRVITAQQISSAAGRSLAEVLQRFGGVQMHSNGGRGNTQSITIRGSKQVILLVDGSRFGSVTDGSPSLASLPLEAIERIEVVHGPASALYGSDAIGGVIQIFTKQGQGAGRAWQPYAAATMGHAGYHDVQAGLGGAQQGWNYSLHVARVVDPGFSSTNAQSSSYHPDADAFRQTSMTAALGYALPAGWRLEGQLMRAHSYGAFDNGAHQDSWVDTQAGTALIKLSGALGADWKTAWSASTSSDKQDTHDVPLATGLAATSRYQTQQREYKWSHEMATRAGVFTTGLERLEQRVISSTVYDRTRRTVNAVYAGLHGSQGVHSWQANARVDDNSQFGSFRTWGLSYGLEVAPGVRVHASRAQSMNTPTFNQLYWPADPQWGGGGNPDLLPEQARNTEVGLSGGWGRSHWKLARYDNQVSNLIVWGNTVENIARARLKGWSLAYGVDWQAWQLQASYEHLDAHDGQGARITRRMPQHQASVALDHQLGRWKWRANALWVGKRTDTHGWPSQTAALGSYTTLDMHVQYALSRDWSLQARMANVLDKDYVTAHGYNQRGRAGFVTLKWSPQ